MTATTPHASAATGTAARSPAPVPAGGSDPVPELVRRLDELAVAGGPFSAEALGALDAREGFPAEACRALDEFGLPRYYVPVEHGGALDDFSTVMRLLRAVSRVDLTVAAAHGKTYLGAVSTWIAGAPDRATWLGRRIAEGAVVSCALTERHHGSDLLAGEVTAREADGGAGWRVTGEKWLINNITRADLVTVLARTDPAGGPRGFSLFLVDKSRLTSEQLNPLPKVPTYGIRGADISGMEFHDVRVPSDALIGEAGRGVEIILKALHLTRTGCVAMSLGAGDHALSLAARFTTTATTDDGTSISELPHVRRELGAAMAGLLLAEATGLVAVRAVHALTAEMSVVSAVAKAYVPAQVDDLVARLLHSLGPYGLLDADGHGRFAKLERDHRIIGIFDGSSLVNRNALIDQFARLSRGYRTGRQDEEGLDEATDLGARLRPFDPRALSLLSGTGASVVAGLPAAVDRVHDLAVTEAASDRLATLAERLRRATDRLHEEMAAVRFPPRAVPGHAFELAERYELCFAAAAALHLWLRRRDGLDEAWLRGCLVTALTELGEPVGETEREDLDILADALLSARPGTVPSLLDSLEGTVR
ncbi:acyl-CoA dehydrogenase family protein [Streptomyces griseorubiginosus]|uniref:acyl-CoA dehydrogenase family protein n=1 Tax=Streptomyces griseorubiginosus TaxID=67304 RepID=UPI001AD785A3|nr:acyl-CoA dehydrogenase family protein [Streptomyces griseorubiginosus]MBO4254979.1 acyl-CoA dehydrogenase [Streptomyces griseorubiginosus]